MIAYEPASSTASLCHQFEYAGRVLCAYATLDVWVTRRGLVRRERDGVRGEAERARCRGTISMGREGELNWRAAWSSGGFH